MTESDVKEKLLREVTLSEYELEQAKKSGAELRALNYLIRNKITRILANA